MSYQRELASDEDHYIGIAGIDLESQMWLQEEPDDENNFWVPNSLNNMIDTNRTGSIESSSQNGDSSPRSEIVRNKYNSNGMAFNNNSRAMSVDRGTRRRRTADNSSSPQRNDHDYVRSMANSPMHSGRRSVHDRMYEDFFLHQEHLNQTKAIVERERQDRIEQTTFRATIGHLSYSPSLKVFKKPLANGKTFHEDLYSRDVQWAKVRDRRAREMGRKIQESKDEAEAAELTLKPELRTSQSMQPRRYQNGQQVFDALYNSKDYYQYRQENLSASVVAERFEDMSFSPSISARSSQLAEKRRRERDEKFQFYKSGGISPQVSSFLTSDNNSLSSTSPRHTLTGSSRSSPSSFSPRSLPTNYSTQAAIFMSSKNIDNRVGLSPGIATRIYAESVTNQIAENDSNAESDMIPPYEESPLRPPATGTDKVVQFQFEDIISGEGVSESKGSEGGVDGSRVPLRSHNYEVVSYLDVNNLSTTNNQQPQLMSTTISDSNLNDRGDPLSIDNEDSPEVVDVVETPSISPYSALIKSALLSPNLTEVIPPSTHLTLKDLSNREHGNKLDSPREGDFEVDHQYTANKVVPANTNPGLKISPFLFVNTSSHSGNNSVASGSTFAGSRGQSLMGSASRLRSSSTGRSGRSTSTMASPKLFESLYDSRYDSAESLYKAHAKYTPTFSHRPSIGINTLYPVESSKEDFFDRLYNHRHYKDQLHEVRLMETISHERGVDPRDELKLSKVQEGELIERLAVKEIQDRQTRSHSRSSRVQQQFVNENNVSIVSKNSEKIMSSLRRKSLGEIFDVLLITVQYQHDNQSSDDQKHLPSDGTADQRDPLLDSSKAQPTLLEPVALATAIGMVLQDFKSKKIGREEFVDRVEELMMIGAIPPINTFLTAPRSRGHVTSTEENINQSMTGSLHLEARKVSERMVERRYGKRNGDGRERFRENIKEYDLYLQSKQESLRMKFEEEDMRECTFTPDIKWQSAGSYDMKETARSPRKNYLRPRAPAHSPRASNRHSEATKSVKFDSIVSRSYNNASPVGAYSPVQTSTEAKEPGTFVPDGPVFRTYEYSSGTNSRPHLNDVTLTNRLESFISFPYSADNGMQQSHITGDGYAVGAVGQSGTTAFTSTGRNYNNYNNSDDQPTDAKTTSNKIFSLRELISDSNPINI